MPLAEWPLHPFPETKEDLPKHLSDFDCGYDDLNHFIKKVALFNQQTGNSRTTYCHSPDDPDTLAGYYSLAIAPILHEEIPPRSRRRLPDRPVHAAPLIARLAVDRRFQKRGLGGRLLVAALADIVVCFERIGGPVIAVQPTDEKAVEFYKHYGFVAVSGAKHMFLRMSTAKKAISAASPPRRT